MARERSEYLVRDAVFHHLLHRLGREETLVGHGKEARFLLHERFGNCECRAEGKLTYELPSGRKLSHTNDILLECNSTRFFGIECKFLSAVTDQFKCRSYDMLHLKKTFAEQLVGIMVYVHFRGNCLSLEQAREICYPFDHFFGFDIHKFEDFETLNWNCVSDVIESEILATRAASA